MTSTAEKTSSPDSDRNDYSYLRVERRGPVALITLDRPKALNALCDALTEELTAALDATEADDSIGAVVLTG
ncbi:MAG: enoyl-CoA hydratase-related protein, partial [Rhodococcus sp. (in: high G+C Gram-positive bacteria)]